MRRAIVATALALLVPVVGAQAGPNVLPTLRFFNLTPAKVRGAHFVPGEQVVVTLRAGAAKRVRTTHALAGGGFVVNFGTLLAKDRCSGSVAVTAVGAHGDRASYRLPSLACTTDYG